MHEIKNIFWIPWRRIEIKKKDGKVVVWHIEAEKNIVHTVKSKLLTVRVFARLRSPPKKSALVKNQSIIRESVIFSFIP